MWIIADMDRTLVDKPPKGGYPTVKDGPTFDSVLRWLEAGHRLCMVTTDAGMRPFVAFWNCIPADYRTDGRLVVATADGAALYYGDAKGELVQDEEYSKSALAGNTGVGSVPGLPPEHMPELLQIAQQIQLAWFDDMMVDPSLIPLLGPREQKYYPLILQRVIRAAKGLAPLVEPGPPGAGLTPEQQEKAESKVKSWPRLSLENAMRIVKDEQMAKGEGMAQQHVDPSDTAGLAAARAKLRELFTLENLLSMKGNLKERGSLIWRNEVGPMTDESIARMEDKNSKALFTSCIVMNVPREVSPKYMEQLGVEAKLKALGLEPSPAPNSLWLKNPSVDKSLPVRYMMRHPEKFANFDIRDAIAFGDNPGGNDEPLTRFVDQGMPFISVAEKDSDTPAHLQANHVGGFEHGTAAVMNALTKSGASSGADVVAVLAEIVPRCRQEIAAGTSSKI